MKKNKTLRILITGLSGSGKSTVLRTLEDIDFYCVDNLPLPLIERFLKETAKLEKVAIGVDARSLEYTEKFPRFYNKIKKVWPNLKLIFTDSTNEILERRFSITRRPHPLGSNCSIMDAIKKEREILKSIREYADLYIETSNMNIHQLRANILNYFDPETYRKKFIITIISFGYSYGLPSNADIIFDARFIKNPFFVPELKELTGENIKVQKFLEKQRFYKTFLNNIIKLLKFYIPQIQKELRFSFTIGIGCTGGMHRSVAIAIALGKHLEKMGYNIVLIHRDIKRGEL
ncbi:MAG: RNase adapter RapZ [Thermoanaerobaculia bacterium]